MPRKKSHDDDFEFEPVESFPDDEELLEGWEDFIDEFPELDYLDELDRLDDDEDFYTK